MIKHSVKNVDFALKNDFSGSLTGEKISSHAYISLTFTGAVEEVIDIG